MNSQTFFIILMILILIVCVLIIFIVLVQNSKGGGLASNFASSNQYMGVRKTADFLEKATWTLAISLLVLSLLSKFAIPSTQSAGAVQQESKMKNKVEENKTAPAKDFQTAPPKKK